MFFNRLSAVEDRLTESERLIADFILENPDTACSMTSYEMSSKLNIGQSTIIRFSKKLGYESFRDLQVSVSSAAADSRGVQEVSLQENTRITNNKITQQYLAIVNLTNDINSAADIEAAVNLIKNSENIMCFGVGNSNLYAQYFANQLIKIGLRVYCTAYAHFAYPVAANYSSNDTVILISESGESKEVIETAAIAKKRGARVISMTRMIKNSLYEYSDVVLKTVNTLSKTRLEAMTIRCSQLCLIDMVYLNLFKTNYEQYSEFIEQAERLID